VNRIVVLHPAINEGEGSSGVRDRADANVIALEGLHESLGHAVTLRAFDRREARHQVERQGDLDSPMSREDRAVVGEPLQGMRCADSAEALFDAADHHVADHLAGDAGGGGDPADHLAVMAIEGEGEAHDLTIPTGELQAIRTPADVGAQRGDMTVMFARPPASGVTGSFVLPLAKS